MKRTGMIALMVIAALAACRTTSGQRTPPPTAGGAVSADEVRLRLDERYVDPSGGLEVQPISIGVDTATLAVRVNGLVHTIELRTGPLGRQTIAPYTFQLTGTSLEPSVSLLITRED